MKDFKNVLVHNLKEEAMQKFVAGKLEFRLKGSMVFRDESNESACLPEDNDKAVNSYKFQSNETPANLTNVESLRNHICLLLDVGKVKKLLEVKGLDNEDYCIANESFRTVVPGL